LRGLARRCPGGGEALVVESGKDCTIPHSVITEYLTALPRSTHVVMTEARHRLEPPFDEQFVEIIPDWIHGL
jgi:hypothetical protein